MILHRLSLQSRLPRQIALFAAFLLAIALLPVAQSHAADLPQSDEDLVDDDAASELVPLPSGSGAGVSLAEEPGTTPAPSDSSTPASGHTRDQSDIPGNTPSTTTTTRPTTTTTTTRSTTASTTGDTGTCTATYRVISQWPGGFQGEVTVTNGRSTASTGWTASFSYADGQRITQAWSATVTQSGAVVSAANLSWNGTLAAAGSTSFGFTASWNGTANSVPLVTCALG